MVNDLNVAHTNYRMYFFALAGPDSNTFISGTEQVPIRIYAGLTNEYPFYIAPVITVDGRITFLPIGEETALNNLQQLVSRIATSQIRSNRITNVSINNFAVVGTSFSLPEAPHISTNVYRVLVYDIAITEYGILYTGLRTYADNLESRASIESYFAQDLQKQWFNDVLTNIQQRLNWNTLCERAMVELRKEISKHEKVSKEKVQYMQIDDNDNILTYSC